MPACLASSRLGALPPPAILARLCLPLPMQDEPFHVPQTQRWCGGRWWEWDPKITTFPGLYFFGVAAGGLEAALLRALGSRQAAPCSTTALRSVNLAFAAACLPLFYSAAKALDPSRTRLQLLLMVGCAGCWALPQAGPPRVDGAPVLSATTWRQQELRLT